MLKHGYMEVTIETPVKGLEKGEKVLVLINELGELSKWTEVAVFKEDENKTKFIIPKNNLLVI